MLETSRFDAVSHGVINNYFPNFVLVAGFCVCLLVWKMSVWTLRVLKMIICGGEW